MQTITRRGFSGFSLAGLSTIVLPSQLRAALPCGGYAVPSRLSIPCASRQNFRLFRQNSSQMGLVGVVNIVNAGGAFDAGTMFLYPWLKLAGQGLRNSVAAAALPSDPWQSFPARFIPDASLPQDQYLCRYVLNLPWQCFIAFSVDIPPANEHAQTAWRTSIPKLSDGAAVAIDWTSSTLNPTWFAGSHVIPDQAACNGSAWRAAITKAVDQAATASC